MRHPNPYFVSSLVPSSLMLRGGVNASFSVSGFRPRSLGSSQARSHFARSRADVHIPPSPTTALRGPSQFSQLFPSLMYPLAQFFDLTGSPGDQISVFVNPSFLKI